MTRPVCDEIAHEWRVRAEAQAAMLARAALGQYDHVDPDLRALVPVVALAVVSPTNRRLAIELGEETP